MSVILFVAFVFVFARYVSDMIFIYLSTLVDMINNVASLSNVTIFVKSESNPDEDERRVKKD